MHGGPWRRLATAVVSVAFAALGAAACASSSASDPIGSTDGGSVDAGAVDADLSRDAAVVTDAPSGSDAPEGGSPDAACSAPGQLDPSFGVGGIAFPVIGGTLSTASSVAIEPSTRLILIGGSARHENALGELALVRLLPDGNFDTSFGANGITLTDIPGYDSWLADIVLQPDGKTVGVGGVNGPPENGRIGLARYAHDGSLDPSFGTGGVVKTQVGALSHACAVALDQQGRIVVAAQTWDGPNSTDPARFVTLRYLSNGTLDPSFGTNGVVITSFGMVFPGVLDLAYDVKVQADGRILVAGGANPTPSRGDFGVVRYDTNGVLDPTYGTGGKALAGFPMVAIGRGIALDALGRAVLAGGGTTKAGTARLGTNGQPDGTFGTMGTYENPSAPLATFIKVVISPFDAKIIAVGAASPSLIVARFNTDGTPDTSFGAQGYVATPTSAPGIEGTDLAIQEDARIVVVGTMITNPKPQDFVAMRFCP